MHFKGLIKFFHLCYNKPANENRTGRSRTPASAWESEPL